MCLSTYNSYIFVCVKVTSNQFSPYVRRRALRIKSHAATRCNTQQHRDTAPNSNTLNKWRQALSLEESCCESKQKNATCVGLFHHTFITLSSHFRHTFITLSSHFHHTFITLSSHFHHTFITETKKLGLFLLWKLWGCFCCEREPHESRFFFHNTCVWLFHNATWVADFSFTTETWHWMTDE